MKLFPGVTINSQQSILGKKVDHYCIVSSGLTPPFRIALECKDWTRPLSREDAASICADYYPLLYHREIDQFLLVTRNGLGSNAQQLFDGRSTSHYTFAGLVDKILDPTTLIENMTAAYESSGLSRYYVPQSIESPDLGLASSQFDLLYNEFMDFALESGIGTLSRARAEWVRYNDTTVLAEVISRYDEDTFQTLIQQRSGRPTPAEAAVTAWLNDESLCEGLAVLGSYGTGKSSLAKRIAHIVALAYRKEKTGRIPFLVELKEFGAHQDIRGLITHELVNRHRVANGSFELFQKLNAAGRFFLILDGFDEMKQGMTGDALLFNFHQLGTLFTGRSRVLLCGRPTLFESEREQMRMLCELQVPDGPRARYVQMQICGFKPKEVATFLTRYVAHNHKDAVEATKVFVADMLDELATNADLSSLLSRPVHLPMLAALLPRRRLDARMLKRVDLYQGFIEAIIEREMLKRKADFQAAYSIEARRTFARQLAVEMLKSGESRSIRVAEIPNSLFEPFVKPGLPLEAVRRDMISACFLERKPPDILYFPHKSYMEFLCAEHFALLLHDDSRPAETDTLPLTAEILSFAIDLTNSNGIRNALRNIAGNSRFVRALVRTFRKDCKALDHDFEQALLERLGEVPNNLLAEIVDYYEHRENRDQVTMRLSKPAYALLARLSTHPDDVIAVHACRALRKHHAEVPLIAVVGSRADLSKWIAHGWMGSFQENTIAGKAALAKVRSELLRCIIRRIGVEQMPRTS